MWRYLLDDYSLTLGFMLSPLPINLFTVDNTIGLGGVLIFIAAQAYRDVKALKAVPAA